jgi:lysozyme
MNEDLSADQDAFNLSRAFEACLARAGNGLFKPYYCPAGVLTIGWGHTNAQGRQFDARARWTQAECDEAHREDMAESEDVVRRHVKVRLNQHQFNALTCFVHNVGETNFAGGGPHNKPPSTLLRKVNRGDFEGAAQEFPKWNRGDGRVLAGLVRRRASEALMFQGIPDYDYDGKPDRVARTRPTIEEPMAQDVDAPEPSKPLTKSKIVQGSTAVIAGESADVLSQVADAAGKVSDVKQQAEDIGVLDILEHLIQNPRFLIAVAVIAAAGLIIYWRWRDHT